MSENWYSGYVPMKPEMKKREFYSGNGDFTYKIPQICFECEGENNLNNKAFEWSRESVALTKNNRTVKYIESSSREVLMTDEDGKSEWIDGGIVDFMGYDVIDDEQIKTVETRWIDEYDWEKLEKRRYKLVLEETSRIERNEIALAYPMTEEEKLDADYEEVMSVSEKEI